MMFGLANVCVVDGITIGDHVVVGMGSIVTKNIPEWQIYAGNPAKNWAKKKI